MKALFSHISFSGGIALVLCLTVLLFTCSAKSPDYYLQMPTRAIFEELKGPPLSDKYGQVEAVKVLYETESGRTLFMHSTRFEYHYHFARRVLGYWRGNYEFNRQNYTEVEGREYLIGTINYYKATGVYTLEFSVADNITKGNYRTIEYSVIPTAVFTIPSIAAVGLTQAQAEDQGMDFRITHY